MHVGVCWRLSAPVCCCGCVEARPVEQRL